LNNAIITFLILITFGGMWGIFKKANYPGWMGLIPGFNLYALLKILDLSPWIFLTYFIPVVGFFTFSYTSYKLAERFNKGSTFTIGIILIPFVFYFILGFDNSKYVKDVN
jgi:uncharacterized membrane protein